ncbi:MAG: aminotransferase class V-fold PLP-dependent enzyme, partial [Anaerolineales bacterium]
MNVEKIRQDFPALDSKRTRKAIVYFDTACQSLRPQVVIDAVNRYYLQEPACSGRSMHQWAAAVTREVDRARELMKKFLNAS